MAHFSSEDVPLSIGLAFDTSGSMDYKMSSSRDAATLFLKVLNPEDEAFLVEFNDKTELSVAFPGRPQEIRNALQKVQPSGLTALLDAVKFSLGEMKNAKNPRKAIVIVSDGGDNHSTYTAAQIEALVREADVEIYAMGVFDPLASICPDSRRSLRAAIAIGDRHADGRPGICGIATERFIERCGENRHRTAQSICARLLPEEPSQRREIPYR